MMSIYEDFNWTTYINDYKNRRNTNITNYFNYMYYYAKENSFFSYLLSNCKDPYNINNSSALLLLNNLFGNSASSISTIEMYSYLHSVSNLVPLEYFPKLPKKDLIFYGDVVNPPKFFSEENQHLLTFFLRIYIAKNYLRYFTTIKDIGDYLDLIILVLQELLYEDASQSYITFNSLSYHKNNYITASTFETEALSININQLLDIIKDIVSNPIKQSSNLFNSWENILSGIGQASGNNLIY